MTICQEEGQALPTKALGRCHWLAVMLCNGCTQWQARNNKVEFSTCSVLPMLLDGKKQLQPPHLHCWMTVSFRLTYKRALTSARSAALFLHKWSHMLLLLCSLIVFCENKCTVWFCVCSVAKELWGIKILFLFSLFWRVKCWLHYCKLNCTFCAIKLQPCKLLLYILCSFDKLAIL